MLLSSIKNELITRLILYLSLFISIKFRPVFDPSVWKFKVMQTWRSSLSVSRVSVTCVTVAHSLLYIHRMQRQDPLGVGESYLPELLSIQSLYCTDWKMWSHKAAIWDLNVECYTSYNWWRIINGGWLILKSDWWRASSRSESDSLHSFVIFSSAAQHSIRQFSGSENGWNHSFLQLNFLAGIAPSSTWTKKGKDKVVLNLINCSFM